MVDKLLYNPEEVGKLLSLSKQKIYDLVRDGELEAHCANGKGYKPMKIVGSSISEYVERHKVPAEDWLE